MPRDRATDRPILRLHEFLRDEREAILQEWGRVDRETLASARELSVKELRNNVPEILEAIAEKAEKVAISGERTIKLPQKAPKSHAEQRWCLGLTLEELTREYSLLRSVILKKLVAHVGEIAAGELVTLNAALDEAIIEGVVTYVARASRAIGDERERLQVTLSSVGDGVVSTDTEGRIIYLNPAAEKMCGWSQEEAAGRPITEVLVAVDETTRHPLRNLTRTAAETGEVSHHSTEILLRQRSGDLLPAEEIAAPLKDAQGRIMGVVTTFRDVSKIRALTSELGYLAVHDPLTGLPNRSLLTDRLTQELGHAERHGDRVALFYLDLDLFKDVNDMLGHSAGDELLKHVAERLRGCVRRTDTVCRLGGDEFVVLVSEFGSLTYLSELGENIAKWLSAPYHVGSDTLQISTSIGVSVYPDDGRDAEELIKHADVAMYQAKALGRNNVQFFAPEMNSRAEERRRLQGDLRNALAADQLSLHFQPQVALDTGEVIGAEALLRWHHPQLGLIPPARFIPVAEGTRDIMISIGNWILEQACRQARLWLDAGRASLRMSVNLSIVQLQYESLLSRIAELLKRFALPAGQLQLELTESILMSDVAGAADRVRALEAMGVRIAVDDFGTGYSSLSYLKDLPVDELKIDQSFIHDIGSASKAAIVQAIIRMGQSLNLRVIAEGVEDLIAVDFLTANGCDGAQGFYYSKAIPPRDFEQQFLNPGVA